MKWSLPGLGKRATCLRQVLQSMGGWVLQVPATPPTSLVGARPLVLTRPMVAQSQWGINGDCQFTRGSCSAALPDSHLAMETQAHRRGICWRCTCLWPDQPRLSATWHMVRGAAHGPRETCSLP